MCVDFINNVQKLGLTDLVDSGCSEVGQPREHGLSLALGGGEISPLQMTGAFRRPGKRGALLCRLSRSSVWKPAAVKLFMNIRCLMPLVAQVIRPEHAYLLSDILADDDARQPAFGRNSSLVVPGHTVSAKTGTSGSSRFDVRDAWTIGYNAGGRHDRLGRQHRQFTDSARGQSGLQLAAPIWNSFHGSPIWQTGRRAILHARQELWISKFAPIRVQSRDRNASAGGQEQFAADQPPLDSSHDFIQKHSVDLWTRLLASDACREAVYDADFFTILVFGNDDVLQRERNGAQIWLEQTAARPQLGGQHDIILPLQLPPQQACDPSTPRPRADIAQPANGASVSNVVAVIGTATGPNYTGYQVDYGLGHEPGRMGRNQRSPALCG